MPVLIMLIRRRLATYLHAHSYRYFQEDFAGRLAGKVVEMPQAVAETTMDVMNDLLIVAMNGLVALVLFLSIDWRFAGIVLLFFSSSILLYRWRIPLITAKADISAASRQAMRGRYLDGITNILLVKLFAREHHEDRLFSASMIEAGKAEQAERWQGILVSRGQNTLNALFQCSMILLCLWLYTQGRLTPGQATTALTLSLTIAISIWRVLMVSSRFLRPLCRHRGSAGNHPGARHNRRPAASCRRRHRRRRPPLRQRRLRLPRPSGIPPLLARHPRRAEARADRAQRRRQVDLHAAGPAPVRCRWRRHPHRRGGHFATCHRRPCARRSRSSRRRRI